MAIAGTRNFAECRPVILARVGVALILVHAAHPASVGDESKSYFFPYRNEDEARMADRATQFLRCASARTNSGRLDRRTVRTTTAAKKTARKTSAGTPLYSALLHDAHHSLRCPATKSVTNASVKRRARF